MFLHQHPYNPFIPKNATKLIIGTIPPPRFSTGTLLEEDVDFCYGSKYGLLWPIFDKIFNLDLVYNNSQKGIEQRKSFLIKYGIGICDMVDECQREKIDASDVGMNHIKLRNLLNYIKNNKSISQILFMGGNSKNGPEFLFRGHLRSHDLRMDLISPHRPKIHEFMFDKRKIRTISLISPSSAANRSIGADPYFKSRKKENQNFTTLDFRVEQYQKYFS